MTAFQKQQLRAFNQKPSPNPIMLIGSWNAFVQAKLAAQWREYLPLSIKDMRSLGLSLGEIKLAVAGR